MTLKVIPTPAVDLSYIPSWTVPVLAFKKTKLKTKGPEYPVPSMPKRLKTDMLPVNIVVSGKKGLKRKLKVVVSREGLDEARSKALKSAEGETLKLSSTLSLFIQFQDEAIAKGKCPLCENSKAKVLDYLVSDIKSLTTCFKQQLFYKKMCIRRELGNKHGEKYAKFADSLVNEDLEKYSDCPMVNKGKVESLQLIKKQIVKTKCCVSCGSGVTNDKLRGVLNGVDSFMSSVKVHR